MVSVDRSHPLYGSFSKLDRARRHIEEFQSAIFDYRRLATSSLHRVPAGYGAVHIQIKLDQPLPDELYHSAAEAVYHVRSALDQMLVTIAQNNGANDLSSIQFPFMSSAQQFNDKGQKQKMKGLPDDVKDLIYQAKPWKDGGDANFWGLGQLANVDKHRFLIPFGGLGGPKSLVNPIVQPGVTNHPEAASFVISRGDLLKGVTISTIAEEGSFTFGPGGSWSLAGDIVFAEEVSIFALREAAPIIEDLIQLGEGIVQTFSKHCFGK